LTSIVAVTSGYWTFARYTDFVFDELLETHKWGNVTPLTTFFVSLLTILILFINLKYHNSINTSISIFKTIKIGIGISIPFILLATLFWSDSWSDTPNYSVPDARELGDGIFSVGHPLTFLIIDLPIYLRHKFDGLQYFWNDYWAYPTSLILFIVQIIIYIQGIRLLINFRKIKTAYKTGFTSGGLTSKFEPFASNQNCK
jgi:hypothetical protein